MLYDGNPVRQREANNLFLALNRIGSIGEPSAPRAEPFPSGATAAGGHAGTTLGGPSPRGRVMAESFVGHPHLRARCRQPLREAAVPRKWELPTMRGREVLR